MLVYMVAYGHIYIFMLYLGAQEVPKTSSKCIYTQEAGVNYTNLTQLQFSATQFLYIGLEHQPSYPNTWQ